MGGAMPPGGIGLPPGQMTLPTQGNDSGSRSTNSVLLEACLAGLECGW